MSRVRPVVSLLENINQHLGVYSAAALTAGVGMLALAQPAEGEVVITKTTISVGFFSPASIDLNKDGTTDFFISFGGGGYDHSGYRTLAITPLAGGKVVAGNRGYHGPYASALMKGANIGPSAHFSSSVARGEVVVERSVTSQSASIHRTYYGQWQNVSDRYLGVKFLINGATHYGWIRLTVDMTGKTPATITAYAYETVANQKVGAGSTNSSTASAEGSAAAIAAPAGPSLGMLALGSNGLDFWRKEINSVPVPTEMLNE